MPYRILNAGLDYEQSRQGWQLRVHLAPQAVEVQNPNNRIEDIREVMADVFDNVAVDVKLYQINDMDEYQEHYDGAFSHSGKDRTQLGKEICIYLPDADVPQLSAADYKIKLLLLWKKLQEKNIPLHYMNLPGDQEVIVLDGHASPFSYTSNNPDRAEWLDKHGILFKQFKANGEHPVLDVFFTVEDLKEYGISREETDLKPSDDFLSKHRKRAIQDIPIQLLEIYQQATSYRDFLFEKGTAEKLITDIIMDYSSGMKVCKTSDERAEFQEAFATRIEKNMNYQFFINAYPKNPDSNFSQHSAIDEISATIKHLTEERLDRLIEELRTEFDAYVKQIEQDFLELPEPLLIRFFPSSIETASIELNPINLEKLNHLITTNPSKMQSIFRQMAIIHQEKVANIPINPADKLLSDTLKTNEILINKLNNYKTNRDKSNSSYLNVFGFLSRPFGAFSKKEKFDAVNNVIEVLRDPSKSLDPRHLGALNQGTLGKLLEKEKLDLTALVADQNRPAAQG